MRSTLEIRAFLVICRDWFAAQVGGDMNVVMLDEMIADIDAVVDYGVGDEQKRGK